MFLLRKAVYFRRIETRSKYLYQSFDVATVQNIRTRKSFAFEANMRLVLQTIRQMLSCNEDKAYNIYDAFPSIRSMDTMTKVKTNIEVLMKRGVSMESITENPFLLVMDESNIWTYRWIYLSLAILLYNNFYYR